VAVEVRGAGAARPWLDGAGATFPTVVDSANMLGEALGYKVIPNGILLDESGAVRFHKFGGFSVTNGTDVEAVERLLAAPPANGAAASGAAVAPVRANAMHAAQRVTMLQRGLDLLRAGNQEGALWAWREALAADPANYVIRKQIWAVEHPERFYPTIDWAWQKEQLARERQQAGETG
jgi:hypothetical protein